MKFFRLLLLPGLIPSLLLAETPAPIPLSEAQQKLRSEFASRMQSAEKKNAAAIDAEGWLFFAAELRFLSLGRFWGDEAPKVSRAHKPELADPIPAIVDFQKQLKARGIDLLVVPVPPKAAVYPEKFLPGFNAGKEDAAPVVHRFYEELRAAGIEVLDLMPLLLQNPDENNRSPVFCRTDSHWSGTGCLLAARAIAENLKKKIATPPPRKEFVSEWKEVQITGDLIGLLPSDAKKPGPEKINVRKVSEKGSGAEVEPDPNSPVLLLGDSHTLVFHEFLAEHAGLVDQLALELGFSPDLIGTRGSGATPVRISLYRHSLKNPDYLAKKKVVVWCFAAREFTEATEGWGKIPIAK